MTITKSKPVIQYTKEDTLFTLMLKTAKYITDDELKVFYEKFTNAPDFWLKLNVLEQYVTIETGCKMVDELNNLV